jgi:hypothetical protein
MEEKYLQAKALIVELQDRYVKNTDKPFFINLIIFQAPK